MTANCQKSLRIQFDIETFLTSVCKIVVSYSTDKSNIYPLKTRRILFTGDFYEEWNEITPQTHIRKFEELTA